MADFVETSADSTGRNGTIAAIGRVLIAAIFVWSGYSKLTNQEYVLGYINSFGLPAPTLALWGAIFVELVGGLALAVGFKTRIVAIFMAVYSIVAAFIFHTDFADPNQMIHFFKNLAMTGGLLQLVAFGAGPLALDRGR